MTKLSISEFYTRLAGVCGLNTIVRQALLASVLVIVSLSSIAQSERIKLPDIGASAETVLSPQFEKEYGEALLRQMRAYDILLEDPQIQAFFSDMGYRLVANSDRPDKHFSFVVLKDPSINAFAAPGGVVALHAGLVMAAESESEVAGVLAHEVSHVTQLHLARAVEKAQQVSIPMMLAMMGLILAGGGSGDAVTGALLSTTALTQQMQINFTRHNEHEADRLGIQTLASAGYDPDGMAAFFGKLNRLTRANGEGPPEFLRTHPVTTTRIAEAKNRAAQMVTEPRSDNLDFYLMRARMKALQEEFVEAAIRYFNHQLENEEFTPISDASNHYGLSVAMLRSGKLEESRVLIERLVKNDPNRLTYQIQLTELDKESRNYEAAIERLEQLHNQFQGNHVIAIHLVRALLSQNTEAAGLRAIDILREQLVENTNDPALYDLFAQACVLADEEVRSGEAVAEAQFLRGRVHESVLKLRNLTRRDDLDYYQRARISARLSELEIILVEDPRLKKEDSPG